MNRATERSAPNLSDSRKNRLGSAILRGILSVFGPAAACFLVKFIGTLAYRSILIHPFISKLNCLRFHMLLI